MRLSKIFDKESFSLDKEDSARMTPAPTVNNQTASSVKQSAPPKNTSGNTALFPPSQPSETENTNEKLDVLSEKGSLYDSLPSAIYSAAKQLDIPIPVNKHMIIQNTLETMSKVMKRILDPSDNKDEIWVSVRNAANDLSTLISLDSNFAKNVKRLATPKLTIISHSINTALIAMDFMKNVKNTECSTVEMGAAALLHDAGISALNLDFQWDEKPTPDFVEHVKKSVEILNDIKAPEVIKTIVAQHHERIDGKGYPEGISGKAMLVASQILSLCESFERIACEYHNDSKTTGNALNNYVQATLQQYRTAFQPDILKAFISMRGFYPDGTMVELTNRSICLVVKQNEGFPLKPVVQVVLDGTGNHPDTAKIINLRDVNSLSIIQTVTQNGEQGTTT